MVKHDVCCRSWIWLVDETVLPSSSGSRNQARLLVLGQREPGCEVGDQIGICCANSHSLMELTGMPKAQHSNRGGSSESGSWLSKQHAQPHRCSVQTLATKCDGRNQTDERTLQTRLQKTGGRCLRQGLTVCRG